MTSHGVESTEEQRRGGIGIAPANHVYGPANVHMLPCRIHHTGPAAVVTYFRPQSLATLNKDNPGDEILALAKKDGDEKLETKEDKEKRGTSAKDAVVDGEKKSAAAVLGKRKDGQVWEHFDDDPHELTARFRGRKFIGRKVSLPEGVHGVVVREKPWPPGIREENEELTSFWAAETSFREITVWGHDEVRRDTPVDRCLAWLEISNSVHDP